MYGIFSNAQPLIAVAGGGVFHFNQCTLFTCR